MSVLSNYHKHLAFLPSRPWTPISKHMILCATHLLFWSTSNHRLLILPWYELVLHIPAIRYTSYDGFPATAWTLLYAYSAPAATRQVFPPSSDSSRGRLGMRLFCAHLGECVPAVGKFLTRAGAVVRNASRPECIWGARDWLNDFDPEV
ncbi:hypothetical protein M3J09_000290 [Ascochyta lentis]